MERIVIDASIATKWLVSERGTDRALRLRDLYLSGGLELIAPALIYYEVANALRFHPHYRLTEAELLSAVVALGDMQIAMQPTTEIWSKAFEISISEGIAIYDSIYIAMPLTFDAKLVTSDKKLVEKLSGEIKKRVSLLEELI